MNLDDLSVGDHVYRWWDTDDDFGMTQQQLTVDRKNPVTVTVITRQGNRFRIHPNQLIGHVPDDEWEG